MPTHIEKAIKKMIRDIIWNKGKALRISIGTLQCPIDEGGLKIHNISVRNKVIKLMWMKAYLNFTDNTQHGLH